MKYDNHLVNNEDNDDKGAKFPNQNNSHDI